MGFVLIIIVSIFVINSVAATMSTPPKYASSKFCPPHKWQYNADGCLYCPLCSKTPAQTSGLE